MTEEINESVLFPINENEETDEKVTVERLQTVTRKWKNYFLQIFKKQFGNGSHGLGLIFFAGSNGSYPTLLSEDMERSKLLLVGENLLVEKFNCGVLEAKPTGKIVFRIQVIGRVSGFTIGAYDANEIWQFTYDLMVDAKNFETIKRANVYYDKKNKIFFGCTDGVLNDVYAQWLAIVVKNLKYKPPEIDKRQIRDDFTTHCILPIIRNVLLEVYSPHKKEIATENGLSYHVNYGTW